MGEGHSDIFLSHSKRDRDWVESLKNALEARQVTVWFDEEQLLPGDAWVDGLERALSETRSVGLVVTPEALESPWVKEEYQRAIILANRRADETSRKVRLIPILLRSTPLPGFLEGRMFVDFTDQSQFEHALERLILGIREDRGTQRKSSTSETKTAIASGPSTPTPVREGIQGIIDETDLQVRKKRPLLVGLILFAVIGGGLLRSNTESFGGFTTGVIWMLVVLCLLLVAVLGIETYRERTTCRVARMLLTAAPGLPVSVQIEEFRKLVGSQHVIAFG